MKNGVREIAKLAKVSIGTVSNVINRPEMVAPETVARVHSAMEELHYVVGERRKGRQIFGFGDSAQGKDLIHKASASGLHIAEVDFSDDSKREQFLRYLLNNKSAVAGLLVVTQAGQIAADLSDFLHQIPQ